MLTSRTEEQKMAPDSAVQPAGLWERYVMAMDAVTERLERIVKALDGGAVPYALIGGQAGALWVAPRDPAAGRTTKDVDIPLRREDLPPAPPAALASGSDF